MCVLQAGARAGGLQKQKNDRQRKMNHTNMHMPRQAWALQPAGAPKAVCDVIVRGRTSWLQTEDITDILRNHRSVSEGG